MITSPTTRVSYGMHQEGKNRPETPRNGSKSPVARTYDLRSPRSGSMHDTHQREVQLAYSEKRCSRVFAVLRLPKEETSE